MEEEYDEKLKIEEEEAREKAREERIKARDAMKELRSQRVFERELKSSYLKSRVSDNKLLHRCCKTTTCYLESLTQKYVPHLTRFHFTNFYLRYFYEKITRSYFARFQALHDNT